MYVFIHVTFCMQLKFHLISGFAFLLFSSLGLNSPCLFKFDGDKRVLQQLVSMYNQGKGSSLYDQVWSLVV